jgi:nitrate reductase molybdenum cofactor assembly chaperone NarJ/NarW
MTASLANAYRVLSALLDYPDDDLLLHLSEIASVARRLPDSDIKTAVEEFLAYLGGHAAIQLQENFTAAFDMRSDTTLNLTYHAYGDNEKRAAALARLQHMYDAAGWQRIGGELPDYLPLLLEFLAIHPRPETAAPAWQCLKATQVLVARLEQSAPAYALLLRPLARMAAAADRPVDSRAQAPV